MKYQKTASMFDVILNSSKVLTAPNVIKIYSNFIISASGKFLFKIKAHNSFQAK